MFSKVIEKQNTRIKIEYKKPTNIKQMNKVQNIRIEALTTQPLNVVRGFTPILKYLFVNILPYQSI